MTHSLIITILSEIEVILFKHVILCFEYFERTDEMINKKTMYTNKKILTLTHMLALGLTCTSVHAESTLREDSHISTHQADDGISQKEKIQNARNQTNEDLDKVKNKAKEIYDKSKEKTENFYEKGKDKAEESKEKLKEEKSKVGEAADAGKEKAKEIYDKGKEKSKETKTKIGEVIDVSKEKIAPIYEKARKLGKEGKNKIIGASTDSSGTDVAMDESATDKKLEK